MSAQLPRKGNPKGFPASTVTEITQANTLNQSYFYDIDLSGDHQEIYLPLNGSSAAAAIYGGVATSVPTTAPFTQQEPESKAKSEEKSSSPSATANWSTSLQTLLDKPPSALPQRLVLGGMVFCLAFAAWATFGKIDEVGHAQGRLVPKGEVYKIDPLEGGKVVSIAVKEGQSVKAGQVVVELDSQMAMGEVERLQQSLMAYQIELTQKQTLLEKAALEGRTRSQIAQAEAQAQQAAIAQSQAKTQAQEIAIAQNHQNAATKQQLLTQLQADAAAYQARQERLKPLLREGAISTEQVFQGEQALRDRQRSITQSQGELQQAQSESVRLQAQLQQARSESNQLQAGLSQKQAEGRRTQIEVQQQLQQLEVDMTQIKAKIAETQNLLTSAKTKLNQRFLYAPVDGVISSLNIRNTGEVLQPGQTVAEIAPKDAPLVLSAILPNREAGFVKTGMPVQVKLDAYPYQDYGIVSGKVTSVSPDTKTDDKFGSVYRVKIALNRNYVKSEQGQIQFKAGQTASADIVIRQHRIADIFLDPIRQLQKGGLSL